VPTEGRTEIEDVSEQGAAENTGTYEGKSNSKLEKFEATSKKTQK
jgi:hypothetical protein